MKLNIYYLLFFDGPVAQFKFYKNKNRIRIFIIPINKGKQIAYIDYCHWRQLYIYINKNPWTMNLSTADLRNYWTEFHETGWSYRYMFLVDPKVFTFVVKGVKVIF
jgi:hypothetical protein